MNLRIDNIGGLCPVQAVGTIDGVPFYFRARGQQWQMAVGNDPIGVSCGMADGWRKREPWGDSEFAAGHMPIGTAEEIIRQCAMEYIESKQP